MEQKQMNLVVCDQLVKEYKESATTTQVLKGLNLTIDQGAQLAILGQSGSGKSTLLHILGMLDTPSSGGILIDQQNTSKLSEQQKATYRNHNMGFIYQFHHLLSGRYFFNKRS